MPPFAKSLRCLVSESTTKAALAKAGRAWRLKRYRSMLEEEDEDDDDATNALLASNDTSLGGKCCSRVSPMSARHGTRRRGLNQPTNTNTASPVTACSSPPPLMF